MINLYRSNQHKTPERSLSIAEVHGLITTDYEAETAYIRAADGDKKEQNRRKAASLKVVTYNAGFGDSKAQANLDKATGLCFLDFDHLTKPDEWRDSIIKEPGVVLAYVSSRGEGGHAVVAYEPVATSPYLFTKAWEYLAAKFGAETEVDSQAKNINRLAYLSHDPDARLNVAALESPVQVPKTSQPNKASIEARDRLDKLAQQVGGTLNDDHTEMRMKCPAHDSSSTDSLSISAEGNAHCFNGCEYHDIMAALHHIMLNRFDAVMLIGRNEAEEADEIAKVLAASGYTPDGEQVFATHLGIRTISGFITEPQLHYWISKRVQCARAMTPFKLTGTAPSRQLVGIVAERLGRQLPVLAAVKHTPFVWQDELVLTDGYHADSQYYLDIGCSVDTTMEMAEAVATLDDLLGQFPYETPSDRANAYGFLLGAALRAEHTAPMLFVTKPQPQTGASKLCQSIAGVSSGDEPDTITAGKTEETEKRLVMVLKRNPSDVLIDNIQVAFDSDLLASGATAKRTGSRALGTNEEIAVDTRSLALYMTGNNTQLSQDLLVRSLSVRLDANVPHPELRVDWRYDLPGAAYEGRVRWLSAATSIVQRWLDAGSPKISGSELGSFQGWCQGVAGILAEAGIEGFNQNRVAAAQRSGGEQDAVEGVIRQWKAWLDCQPKGTRTRTDNFGVWTKLDNAKAIGSWVARQQDRVFELEGGLYKVVPQTRDKKGAWYDLVLIG